MDIEMYKEQLSKLISENSKLKNDVKRLKEEILDRIYDVISNNNYDELDLLRHDLENDIIK